MTDLDPHDDAAAEREVGAWLAAQRPEPPPALRRLGTLLVRRAVRERVLRRSAAALLVSGWLALAAAAVIVLTR